MKDEKCNRGSNLPMMVEHRRLHKDPKFLWLTREQICDSTLYVMEYAFLYVSYFDLPIILFDHKYLTNIHIQIINVFKSLQRFKLTPSWFCVPTVL
jgi:uncharacterized membrane protein